MSGSPPVVGVTTYVEPASYGVWTQVTAAFVPAGYVRQLEASGAVAMLLPPRRDPGPAVVEALLGRLDALVVAGGADVDPARYGASPHPRTQGPQPDRDSFELALVRRATELDLPLLGVCRGMQVMAVAAGGTLSQHVPDLTGTSAHAPAPGHYGQTQVTSTHGSRVARIIGGAAAVRCSHHQSVATAPGYVGTAYSADGVLEAMEAPSARFRLGVQWHPEASDDTCVFAALVTAAAHAPSRR